MSSSAPGNPDISPLKKKQRARVAIPSPPSRLSLRLRDRVAVTMVYIPWAQLGICRYWMVDRCNMSDGCQWQHPPPAERKRLWDHHTALQDEAAARGIPRPVQPPKHDARRLVSANQEPLGVSRGSHDQTRSATAQQGRLPRQTIQEWDLTGALQISGPQARRNEYVPTLEDPAVPESGDVANIASTDRRVPVWPWTQQQRKKKDRRTLLEWTAEEDVYGPLPVTKCKESKWDVKPEMSVSQVVGDEVWDKLREISVDKPHIATSLKLLSKPTTTSAHHDDTMGTTKLSSRGEPPKHVGPHPSTIRISAPYMTQATISKLQRSTAQSHLDLQERSIAEAREDNVRLQGVAWIDNVRRALQLPIRTFTTACVYFHKFRLAHTGSLNGMDYGNAWIEACAASLLTSCKVEDTLKKSRDILAAAYNLKTTAHDQVGADDPIFEAPSRTVIGLERLVLEAGGFDFRTKHPHKMLIKLAKSMPEGDDGEREKVGKLAWTVLTDLYRTFAPLKQTSVTMSLACLELAACLVATKTDNNTSAVRDALQSFDLEKWSTSREEIMETLLDLLDLYTQHTAHSILGTQYSLDDFLRIRLAFNKECNENNIPRYTTKATQDDHVANDSLRVSNGHPTPVSPMEPGSQQQTTPVNTAYLTPPEGGGTLRFMLDPQRAADEKARVQKYFVEEWEEYEEEVEIPDPLPEERERERGAPNRTNETNRGDYQQSRSYHQSRDERSDRPSNYRDDHGRDRPRWQDHDRDHRRYHDPGRGPPPSSRGRFNERRGGGRYDDRARFEDERHRR